MGEINCGVLWAPGHIGQLRGRSEQLRGDCVKIVYLWVLLLFMNLESALGSWLLSGCSHCPNTAPIHSAVSPSFSYFWVSEYCSYNLQHAGNFLVPADELSVNGFRTVMEIDAIGTFSVSRAAFPALRQAPDGGVIINISATLHYGATFWQVRQASQCLYPSLHNMRLDTPYEPEFPAGLQRREIQSGGPGYRCMWGRPRRRWTH